MRERESEEEEEEEEDEGGGREVKKKSESRSATQGKKEGKGDRRKQRIVGGGTWKGKVHRGISGENKEREHGGSINEGGGLARKEDNGDVKQNDST